MNKLIYIASALSNAGRVRALRERFLKLGILLTYDWTSHNGGSVYIGDDQPGLKREVADKEVDGVTRAEAVLVVMPGGNGTHFEFGLAYALGKPIVLLTESGLPYTPCFHFLDSVIRCSTEDAAVESILRIPCDRNPR